MKQITILFLASAILASCAPREFTFIQMSDPQIGFLDPREDCGVTDSLFRRAAERANGIGPECVIITGDLVNVAGDALQDSLYRAGRGRIEAPVYEVPGNHDGRTPDGRFSFRRHGCAFIGIDSNLIKGQDAAAEREQLDWLRAELESAGRCRYRFVFLHCPVFIDAADEPEQYFNFPVDKRRQYLELLHDYSVDAVFAGHTHMDSTAEWEGIRFYVAGPVGTPLGRGRSGFNVVKVRNDGFDVEFLPL